MVGSVPSVRLGGWGWGQEVNAGVALPPVGIKRRDVG